MRLWEYLTQGPGADLDALGADGWELVAVISSANGERFYFKRERGEATARFTREQKEAFFAARGATPTQQAAPPILLNPEVAAMVRSIRHTEMLLLADQGFPVPPTPLACDLSLRPGLPTILDVLEVLQGHFHADRMILAEEMQAASPGRVEELKRRFPHLRLEFHPHLTFKALAAHAKGAIRTGDDVPYANLLLVSG